MIFEKGGSISVSMIVDSEARIKASDSTLSLLLKCT